MGIVVEYDEAGIAHRHGNASDPAVIESVVPPLSHLPRQEVGQAGPQRSAVSHDYDAVAGMEGEDVVTGECYAAEEIGALLPARPLELHIAPVFPAGEKRRVLGCHSLQRDAVQCAEVDLLEIVNDVWLQHQHCADNVCGLKSPAEGAGVDGCDLAALSSQIVSDSFGLYLTGGGERAVTPPFPVAGDVGVSLSVADEDEFGHHR